jgi:ATP-dependent DNA helicase DinG
MATRLERPRRPPLPEWARELRPHQVDARREIGEHYAAGKKLVLLDGPVGSGKTLVGEVVRRDLGQPTTYICSDKQLQRQFVGDFTYAALLQGKKNYRPELVANGAGLGFIDADCGDCDGRGSCKLCSDFDLCPYQVAKREAMAADLAVINTAYALSAWNYTRDWEQRKFVVADECDTLEGALLGFVEFVPPKWMMERVLAAGVAEPPKKGSHMKTIAAWMRDELAPGLENLAASMPRAELVDKRRRQWVKQVADQAAAVAMELVDEDGGKWVRDNDAGPMVMKPISVAPFGQRYLWQHSRRWMLMSGTIISAEQMLDELGYDRDDWALVTMPMTFPAKNRPIRIAPVANVTNKTMKDAIPKLAAAIVKVLDLHPGDRVLVHCVSRYLADELHGLVRHARGGTRLMVKYSGAREREAALATYRQKAGAVMFAQSMDRGVDLRDDDCRVQIIAKVPFPNLGDAQVERRTYGRGGAQWFGVQSVRTIVQMTGRGVRHKDDHAVTYILDSQFTENLYKKHGTLFPKYWREAIDRSFRAGSLR